MERVNPCPLLRGVAAIVTPHPGIFPRFSAPMPDAVVTTQPKKQRSIAVRFFWVCLAIYGAVWLLTWLLIRFVPYERPVGKLRLPPALWISTTLLFAGSWQMLRAVYWVRRERQREFRRALRRSLITGTLFVSLQGYGLWCLLPPRTYAEAQTGVNGFVFVLAFLHALHFTIALMFLTMITLKAFNDRYDHEYYWGVVACGYFWHFLGAVWTAILAVFLFAYGM